MDGLTKIAGAEAGAAMLAVLKNPNDAKSVAVLDRNPKWHAILRTTCVATMLSAGHATNALPQRATANINCRIFPGVTSEAVLARLVKIADDPAVTVSIAETRGPGASPTTLTPRILQPVPPAAPHVSPVVPR